MVIFTDEPNNDPNAPKKTNVVNESKQPKGIITPQPKAPPTPHEQIITTTIRFSQVVAYEVTGPIESKEFLFQDGPSFYELCQKLVEDGEFSDIQEVGRGDVEIETVSFPAQQLVSPTELTSPPKLDSGMPF